MSHDAPVTHPNDAPCDNSSETRETIDNNKYGEISTSHETPVTHPNETPKHVSKTHYETKKKRGLFGRVLNAVFDND
jgi:hypothetical protein